MKLLLLLMCAFSLETSAASIQIIFIIDEDYLVVQTLAKKSAARGPGAGDVEDFRALAKKIDASFVDKVQATFSAGWHQALLERSRGEWKEKVDSLKGTREFGKILAGVRDYAAGTREEWDRNLPRTYKLMRELTLLPLEKDAHIYLTHPAVGTGNAWDEENRRISFGAHPLWENYFTVYVWHELLHLEFPGFDDATHSLIQLATDCWLREQLNGTPYPPFEGHEELYPQMGRLIPLWQSYLANPDGFWKLYGRIPEGEKTCGGQACE